MSKKVLIIEDEIVLQNAYRMILESKNYLVHTSNNAAKGLEALREVKPDMVLLDISMPVMDGKEFLRNIKINDYPTTKFVAYTNLSDKNTETEMLGLGAYKVILKADMGPGDLLKLVAEVLES